MGGRGIASCVMAEDGTEPPWPLPRRVRPLLRGSGNVVLASSVY